jgi:3'-phosphoadenosine 5'-phosphosulfate sulfotransferase
MTDLIQKVADKAVDAYEALTHDQARRTGVVAARVDASLKKKVDPEVLALQMTKNEARNNRIDPVVFTAEDMPAIAKLHRANKRRPALTKAQTSELMRNQEAAEAGDMGGLPA